MFGSNKADPKGSSRSAGVETLIGRQTEITGNVRFSGGLHLDGRVLGNISAAPESGAHLSISTTGSVEGNVQVASLVLNGSVVGDVHTSDKITLGAKARVTGDVHYQLIEMQGGAQVNGKLVHASAEPPATIAEAVPPADVVENTAVGQSFNGQSYDQGPPFDGQVDPAQSSSDHPRY